MAQYPITTPISAAPVLVYTPSPSGQAHVYAQNLGTSTLYLGLAGVTSSGGMPLAPNQSIDLSTINFSLYAVCGYTPTATSTTIATSAVGHGTSVSTAVVSGTGTSNGQYVVVGAGTSAETTTIASGGGTTTLVLTQLLDDHNVGAPVTVVTPFPSTLLVAGGAS